MNGSASLLFLALLVAGCGARTIGLDEFEDITGDAAVGDTGGVVPGSDATPKLDSGGVVVDTAPPPGLPITCGRTTCDSAKQECCLESEMAPPECTPKGSCAGASFACSSASSCGAGLSCCFNQDTGQAVCKSRCEGMGPEGEVTLCTSTAECPPRLRCRRAGAGFSVCAPG